MLDIEQSEILFKLNTNRVGARLMTALIFGATRKYHRGKFPSINEVDDFVDRLEEESENFDEDVKNLSVGLMAAFTGASPTEIEARLLGEEEVPASVSSDESDGADAGPKKVARPGARPGKPAKSSGGAS